MALLTASALGKTIRENDIDSLYYFYGHDTAALESFTKRLVNKLCPADAQVMNFHKLDGKNLDFPMLTDACEALPFMAERVVVTINDLNIDAVTKDDLVDLKKILGANLSLNRNKVLSLPDSQSIVSIGERSAISHITMVGKPIGSVPLEDKFFWCTQKEGTFTGTFLKTL